MIFVVVDDDDDDDDDDDGEWRCCPGLLLFSTVSELWLGRASSAFPKQPPPSMAMVNASFSVKCKTRMCKLN